jgi:hypothetical protein
VVYVDKEEIVRFVKKITLEVGAFEPTIFVKGSTGKVAIALKEFGATSNIRERHMLNAGAFTAQKHSVGELEKLIFVDEAWMSWANKKGEFIQPSLDPKRIETLIINSLDASSQEETMISFEMVRDPKGKLTDFKQMSLPDGSSVKGILLPAFQKGYKIIRPTTN